MRTLAFGQDITDACQFQYGTYRTAGNDAGTFGSRTQEHTACTEHPDNFMRNGGPYGRNRDQIFLSVFYAFPDRFRNFGRFAQAHTYMALTIANHNQ